MTAITSNETGRRWQHHGPAPIARLFLAEGAGQAVMLSGTVVGGFQIALDPVEPDAAIELSRLSGAEVAVVEVSPALAGSIERFEALAKASRMPLIAAVHDPQLALVRSLVRAGAHDVIPLPFDATELEASLAPLRERITRQNASQAVARGKVISVIKSVGGVGATALATQLALRFAAREAAVGREVCLIDLDVQFGDAAFQLGLRPNLSVGNLLDVGGRMDGDLLRATTTPHDSGLRVIAAPPDMMPLEAMTSEQVIDILDHATRDFGTVFVELPTNWTNWSLSVVARSDLVLLVTEINVASLNRARRQLDLLNSQDLADLDVRVVVNRYERGVFKTIKSGDVREALGRDVSFAISNDHPLVRAAIDRGQPIEQIKRKSVLAKDLDALDAGIAASLGLEH